MGLKHLDRWGDWLHKVTQRARLIESPPYRNVTIFTRGSQDYRSGGDSIANARLPLNALGRRRLASLPPGAR